MRRFDGTSMEGQGYGKEKGPFCGYAQLSSRQEYTFAGFRGGDGKDLAFAARHSFLCVGWDMMTSN